MKLLKRISKVSQLDRIDTNSVLIGFRNGCDLIEKSDSRYCIVRIDSAREIMSIDMPFKNYLVQNERIWIQGINDGEFYVSNFNETSPIRVPYKIMAVGSHRERTDLVPFYDLIDVKKFEFEHYLMDDTLISRKFDSKIDYIFSDIILSISYSKSFFDCYAIGKDISDIYRKFRFSFDYDQKIDLSSKIKCNRDSICCSTSDGWMYLLDKERGHVRWKKKLAEFRVEFLIHEDWILICKSDRLIRLSAKTGEELTSSKFRDSKNEFTNISGVFWVFNDELVVKNGIRNEVYFYDINSLELRDQIGFSNNMIANSSNSLQFIGGLYYMHTLNYDLLVYSRR